MFAGPGLDSLLAQVSVYVSGFELTEAQQTLVASSSESSSCLPASTLPALTTCPDSESCREWDVAILPLGSPGGWGAVGHGCPPYIPNPIKVIELVAMSS